MYQALYRKYRPKNFDEVVGQKYVIQTLKNEILNDKINHAYMFFGPRGIGKTTIANIIANIKHNIIMVPKSLLKNIKPAGTITIIKIRINIFILVKLSFEVLISL